MISMISFGGYGRHKIESILQIKAHTLPVSVRQSPVVFISVSGFAIYSISSKIEKRLSLDICKKDDHKY